MLFVWIKHSFVKRYLWKIRLLQISSIKNKTDAPKSEILNKIWNAIDQSITISITDKNGDIIFVNDNFCRLSKYSQDELIGQNHRVIKSEFHNSEFYEEMWKRISNGKIWRGEVKNKDKEGNHYWVKSTIVPILDESNQPIEYVSIRTDITKQKLNEEKLQKTINSLNLSKEQIQELKTNIEFNEDFINIASHELKTPIQPILGFIELAKSGVIDNDEAWDGIQELATELSVLMDTVLEVSRVDRNAVKLNLEKISLNKFIYNIINSIQQSLNSEISLEDELDKDIEITIDKTRLTQVIRNLINNSIKFTPKGKITIKSQIQEKQNRIEISISDNGSGIDPKVLPKLFNKFVTSGKVNNNFGTGLGLFLSKGIIEAHRGEISGYNNQNGGATFRFSLPINQN